MREIRGRRITGGMGITMLLLMLGIGRLASIVRGRLGRGRMRLLIMGRVAGIGGLRGILWLLGLGRLMRVGRRLRRMWVLGIGLLRLRLLGRVVMGRNSNLRRKI